MAIYSTTLPPISVFATSNCLELAQDLAKQLNLPLVDNDKGLEWLLIQTPEHTALRFPGARKPFFVDFLQRTYSRRLQHPRAEPLVRAMGIKVDEPCHIIDGTAGFGTDSVLLAKAGAQVIALERSPIVACLLADGLRRLKLVPAFANLDIQIKVVDTVTYLTNLTKKPDAIYLDPMFPERPNQALVKKPMQLLQQLTDEPSDDKALLQAALDCGCKRVVVKRPEWAPSLLKDPSYSVPAGIIRFDVYGH